MSAFVTLSDVKSALGIDGTAQDGQISAVLEGVDDVIAGYCGRAIAQAAIEEYHDGGAASLVVTAFPIAASPALTITDRVYGGAVSTSTYDLDLTAGVISLKPSCGIFNRGTRRYKVSYTGGFSPGSAPGAIKSAIIKIVEAHTRPAGLISESDMGYSYTLESGNGTGVPAIAQSYLEKYKTY